MKCYIVDAFADRLFEGNPAAVCITDEPLGDELMQSIAIENNLSETAFAVKNGGAYHLRWFTPGGEIDLCGHATLAAAFVLKNFFELGSNQFSFDTLSGRLEVLAKGSVFELDFPSIAVRKYPLSQKMTDALGATPAETFIGRDLLFVFEDESGVKSLSPDFTKLKELDEGLAVFVTAKSDKFDFSARAFWPKLGVNEDPVTGSMFCSLAPFWAKRLGKSELRARQLSKRGGTVHCTDNGSRVKISGSAVLYASSELHLQ